MLKAIGEKQYFIITRLYNINIRETRQNKYMIESVEPFLGLNKIILEWKVSMADEEEE